MGKGPVLGMAGPLLIYRMPSCLIYGLIDPRTGRIRYVGKTEKSLAKRINQHVTQARLSSERTHKLNWIRELLAINMTCHGIVLETVETVNWPEAERKWIAKLRSHGALTNSSDGGEGGKAPPEALKKLQAYWDDPKWKAMACARMKETCDLDLKAIRSAQAIERWKTQNMHVK